MIVLNADIRTFNLYTESLKLYNSFTSLIMHMYFTLTNTLETLEKIKPRCVYFTFSHVLILPTLSIFNLVVSKEKLKGKRTVGHPIFSSVSSFSAEAVNKYRERIW